MSVMTDYIKARDALYKHVGFQEDWVIYPIEDNTEMYWDYEKNNSVRYAETEEKLRDKDDKQEYYEDEIYTQRFYTKWVYKGKEFTMIFCNPGVDGMKWFRVFDNSKRVKIFE